MGRGVLRTMVIVGVVASGCSRKAQDIGPTLASATVLVRTEKASGSGFVVLDEGDDQYIITNQHVIDGVDSGGSVSVTYAGGQPEELTLQGSVVGASRFRDLAVVRSKAPARRPRPLEGTTEVSELMGVIIAGFPFGDQLSLDDKSPSVTLTRASVSSLRRAAGGATQVIQLDNNVNPGNSGGPVVNERGQVVGVTVAAVRGAGIGFVIPWEQASALLSGRGFDISSRVSDCDDDGCDLRLEIAPIDPFHKAKRVDVRIIEIDDEYLRRTHPGGRPEGTVIATASRPQSGAFSVVGEKRVKEGKRYAVQLVFETDSLHHEPPFELELRPQKQAQNQLVPPNRSPPPLPRDPQSPDAPLVQCWALEQFGKSTLHGSLRLLLTDDTAWTGSVQWDQYMTGKVVAKTADGRLRMTVRYPDGTVGVYDATIDAASGALVDGLTEGSEGSRARWSGRRVPCR